MRLEVLSAFEVIMIIGRFFALTVLPVSLMRKLIASNSCNKSFGNSISALSISSIKTIDLSLCSKAFPRGPSLM